MGFLVICALMSKWQALRVGNRRMTDRHPDKHPGMTIRLTLCKRDAIFIKLVPNSDWLLHVAVTLFTSIKTAEGLRDALCQSKSCQLVKIQKKSAMTFA